MKRICLCLAALICSFCLFSQPIASDPEFKVGKLSNGLTYYLCHNEIPAGTAEFYIAHNVGALQEEDNQNGLAHFLEHMAFNGTRHYPDKRILEFLADEGVRFGYNVNAFTSKTETVYNLSNVPLVREGFIDSVLMVLRDWSCDISCEQKALDDERGVISEEWRLGDDSRSRMANQQTNLIYRGSKQAERNVIGTLEVINGFKRQEILDFYHKWYRPDLQAIIVVGDFDADEMERRIRRIFSDIPAAVNPEPKGTYIPPAMTEPLFEDMTDPEIRYQAFKAIYRQDNPYKLHSDESYFKDELCSYVITSNPTSTLRVAEITDRRVDDEELVLAIGKASELGVKGLSGLTLNDWYRNVLLDDINYSADDLLTYAFPALSKSNSGRLPMHKYLSEATKDFPEGRGKALDFDDIISNTIKANRKAIASYDNFSDLWEKENENIDKAFRLLAYFPEEQIPLEDLEKILLELFENDANYLDHITNSSTRSNLRTLILIYDYLKWGK